MTTNSNLMIEVSHLKAFLNKIKIQCCLSKNSKFQNVLKYIATYKILYTIINV